MTQCLSFVFIGDSAFGFWAADRKSFKKLRAQRCCFHKGVNVLIHFLLRFQPRAEKVLHEIWLDATREEAYKVFTRSGEMYGANYPTARECLVKSNAELLAFYGLPAKQRKHLRTTIPIESTFVTTRLKHRKTKGSSYRKTSLFLMFSFTEAASMRSSQHRNTSCAFDLRFAIRLNIQSIRVRARAPYH